MKTLSTLTMLAALMLLSVSAANAQTCTPSITGVQNVNDGVYSSSLNFDPTGGNFVWAIYGTCLSNGSGSSVTLTYTLYNSNGAATEQILSNAFENSSYWYESAGQINFDPYAPIGGYTWYYFSQFPTTSIKVCNSGNNCTTLGGLDVVGPQQPQ